METRFQQGDPVVLGPSQGVVVAGVRAGGGVFSLETPEGLVEGVVLKARNPDVALGNCMVWLVQEQVGGVLQPRYVVLVDDAYWGVRIQPSRFSPAPFRETFVMGYRLRGRVLQGGNPVHGANVSLEVRQLTLEDGETVFWDSEEYNELVYSPARDTWVEGPRVLAPIITDANGEWEFVAPKGHGAIYQRQYDLRDESPETKARGLPRRVESIFAVYRGHKALAAEGSVAVINVDSAGLEITATPGAFVRVGTLDDRGVVYAVPPSGRVSLSNLPCCWHTIVQFARGASGEWDPAWGCPRVRVELQGGKTTSVVMPPLEHYPPENLVVAGRIYRSPGVPAAGLAITIIDLENEQVVGTAAVTDSEGFWSAPVPEDGFGGELFVHDQEWGTVPILGYPYSDVVLGAHAYSSWLEDFKPEAWRKGSWGHRNFPYVPDALWVQDAETERRFEVREVEYGGWVTVEPLPKYRFVQDIGELVRGGPQLCTYDVRDSQGVLESGFSLDSQPFGDTETPPGLYRAAGHYPEAKWLIGGKVHGNLLLHSDKRVKAELPEAARFGLEFGELRPTAEVRSGQIAGPCEVTCFLGVLCPYCGGPAWRDPEPGVAEQGYCMQCAAAFGDPRAMDCRSYFRTPTVGVRGLRWHRTLLPHWDEALVREPRFFWRPELYDETDWFVTQSGAGQPTNAPRWYAKHLDSLADGRAFGQFDGDASPSYIPGHDMSYFEALPEVNRSLGLAQLKLVFAPGYEVPTTFVVDIDCTRADGQVETHRVTVPAGTRGPSPQDPFGDVIRVVQVAKMKSELVPWPYVGVGLYTGVADIRLVEPESAPQCRFTVVGDAPFLASAQGVPVRARASTPVAFQVDRPWGNPHLCTDMFGQVILSSTDEGNIVVRRRGGLLGDWDQANVVAEDGVSDHSWVGKDGAGTLTMVRQRGQSLTEVDWSRRDGREGA